jgi:MFS family permease
MRSTCSHTWWCSLHCSGGLGQRRRGTSCQSIRRRSPGCATLRPCRAGPAPRARQGRFFFAFASSLWGAAPDRRARPPWRRTELVRFLLGAIGAGAIGGALLMPRLQQWLDADGLVLVARDDGCGGGRLGTRSTARTRNHHQLPLGAAWITVLTTLNATTQSVLPNWVRGRGLAVYLMVFNGAMALGSIGWGVLAEVIGVPATLLTGASGLSVAALIAKRSPLPLGEADLKPSNHWPEPLVSEAVQGDAGRSWSRSPIASAKGSSSIPGESGSPRGRASKGRRLRLGHQ